MQLFTYGTLMDPEIMAHVAGDTFPARPGLLAGYRRRVVEGEVYPAIVPDDTEQVEGVVYSDLTDEALTRLDRFEGELYQRLLVPVTRGGELIRVQAYVLRPEYGRLLSSTAWTLEQFLHSGKGAFTDHYSGFERI